MSDLVLDGRERANLESLVQIFSLFGPFLQKRRIDPQIVVGLAARLGLDEPSFRVLVNMEMVQSSYGGSPVSFEQFCATEWYGPTERYLETLDDFVRRGLLLVDIDGAYSIAPPTREVLDQLHAERRAHVAGLQPLPEVELSMLAGQMQRVSEALWSDPELAPGPDTNIALARAWTARGDAVPSMLRLNDAVFELFMARDDAHVKAWRDAGFEGRTIVVLTEIWSGTASTVTGLYEVLQETQTSDVVDENLEGLAKSGLVTREGDNLRLTPQGQQVRDGIERETDRLYFTPWPFTPTEAAWVSDRLSQAISNLPTPTYA